MRRRQFLAGLGGAALTWPLPATAQQPTLRIGVLLFADDPAIKKPFLSALEALGFVDGKNITIEYRYAEGKPERLPELAAELVRLKPDVIYSFGGDVAPI